MRSDRNRRLNIASRVAGFLNSFEATVRGDPRSLKRRDFYARQSQGPPQERCETVSTNELCQGYAQPFADSHHFWARHGSRRVRCFHSQQPLGPYSD